LQPYWLEGETKTKESSVNQTPILDAQMALL